MKSRQNPFQQASKVGKTYYHPSCNQSLSQKKKKTTLSPVRLNQQSSPQLDSLSPEDQGVFEKHDHCFAATDGKPVYEESWPSTEWGSPPASSTSISDMLTEEQSARAGKSTVSSELGVQQDSVLAKYVERFRRGRPQSREERQQMASAIGERPLPFWWMSTSSLPPSSTPTKKSDKDVIQLLKDDHGPAFHSRAGPSGRDGSLSPCRTSLSILSDTSQGEFEDTEILQLQERANRLLLRDDYTLNDGSIQVSSEGLGCSDFSSPVSVDEPVRRTLITAKARSDSAQAWSSQKPSIIPSLVPPTRPEEDILFQWRLRRKMEQARDWPQQHSSLHGPTFSWQAPSLGQTSASGQAYKSAQTPESSQNTTNPHISNPKSETKEALGSCTPSGPLPLPALVVSDSLVSQPHAIAHVPAHMHLLCDVLPCPIQSSHASTQQNLSKSIDASRTTVVRKKAHVPRNTMKTATDERICEHMPSPPSSGAMQGERHRRSENMKGRAQTKESEKEAAKSFRKQKKSTKYAEGKEHADGPGPSKRTSSQHRIPKKILPLAEEQQHEGRRELSTDDAQPASPIHSALGQVVSEVLFPTADSSPAQRTSVSSVSSSHTCSAPPQHSVHPGDEQNSMEVISQLLQEAEDSDEKEFEDDALLQVLRTQRKWVKEQISEVDSILNDFLEKQQGN
uniref:proline and serine-rich protein 3 isoform X2 n=1 Tax=Semicossyphus pulcher TaxID=241346 RepID=UPI0037E7E1A2